MAFLMFMPMHRIINHSKLIFFCIWYINMFKRNNFIFIAKLINVKCSLLTMLWLWITHIFTLIIFIFSSMEVLACGIIQFHWDSNWNSTIDYIFHDISEMYQLNRVSYFLFHIPFEKEHMWLNSQIRFEFGAFFVSSTLHF